MWHLRGATPTRARAFQPRTITCVNAVVLAHQGGWDEILMVAGPVAIFGWLLWVARKRAKAVAALEGADAADTGPAGSVTPPS